MQEIGRRFKETVEAARSTPKLARRVSEEGRAALEAEIKALQAEIAAVKAANQTTADTHDYREAETRDLFIDLLLREAGFDPKAPDTIEVEVTGMPNAPGVGYVDYVLRGDDGKPLALVEAKRTRKDPRVGQQQAKLYADCLEAAVRPAADHLLHATVTSTGFGTTRGIRRGRSRASSRRTSWR